MTIAVLLTSAPQARAQDENQNAPQTSAQESKDFMVYSVYRALDMGNPGETPQKDYYINIGTKHGVRAGAVLEVLRKIPTYDLVSKKFHNDLTFPIARVKIIHAESGSSIARMEKLLPIETTPSVTPRAVMVGDLVRQTR